MESELKDRSIAKRDVKAVEEGREVVSRRKIISYAGAFIALLIGSGFATGQELMQYFAAYGYWGFVGIVIVFLLLSIIGVELIYAGFTQQFENPNEVYNYLGGKVLGTFFDYFSVFFLFLSFTVMVAGAQATVVEQFNIETSIGGIILAAAAVATVVFGLDRIVDVIGSIGPVIIVLAIIVGAISIVMNWGNLGIALENLELAHEAGIMQVASTNFFFSAMSYVGFCLIWLAAFLARLGKGANSVKEGNQGILLGALGFSLACLIMSFAILLSIDRVHASQIPSLILAEEIHPWLAAVFSVVVFLGIYTTAVPLLWNVTARFTREKTNRYRLLTVVLGVIGAFVGLAIDFSQLVNVVYVLNGYIGIVLIVIILYRGIRRRMD